MREILFRGKRIDGHRDNTATGTMVFGSLFIDKNGQPKIKWYDSMLGAAMTSNVDPETVGQSTEMHDRHNTQVFENDIVEFIGSGSTSRYLIWWNREMSMMTAVPLHGIYFNGHDYGNGDYPNFNYSTFCLMMQNPWGDFKDIRVVGNIHDNPELLDVCKNYDTCIKQEIGDGLF